MFKVIDNRNQLNSTQHVSGTRSLGSTANHHNVNKYLKLMQDAGLPIKIGHKVNGQQMEEQFKTMKCPIHFLQVEPRATRITMTIQKLSCHHYS